MLVKCANKKCLHEWNYLGAAHSEKDYITCPKCHYKTMFKKALIKVTHSLTHSQNKEIEEKKSSYKLVENKEGDKLMIFNDGLQVLIPRGEILKDLLITN